MSGSGATCFALFAAAAAAIEGAQTLAAAHPQWWVRATALGGG
jgi:4-diphosphocytidyl-2-C-methyl-D-erythritol kinase